MRGQALDPHTHLPMNAETMSALISLSRTRELVAEGSLHVNSSMVFHAAVSNASLRTTFVAIFVCLCECIGKKTVMDPRLKGTGKHFGLCPWLDCCVAADSLQMLGLQDLGRGVAPGFSVNRARWWLPSRQTGRLWKGGTLVGLIDA